MTASDHSPPPAITKRRPRRPRLTQDWRRAWRWLSVQVAALATVYGLLPVDQQRAILELLHVPAERVTAVIGLAFLVARLLAQQAAGK